MSEMRFPFKCTLYLLVQPIHKAGALVISNVPVDFKKWQCPLSLFFKVQCQF